MLFIKISLFLAQCYKYGGLSVVRTPYIVVMVFTKISLALAQSFRYGASINGQNLDTVILLTNLNLVWAESHKYGAPSEVRTHYSVV